MRSTEMLGTGNRLKSSPFSTTCCVALIKLLNLSELQVLLYTGFMRCLLKGPHADARLVSFTLSLALKTVID